MITCTREQMQTEACTKKSRQHQFKLLHTKWEDADWDVTIACRYRNEIQSIGGSACPELYVRLKSAEVEAEALIRGREAIREKAWQAITSFVIA